MCGLFFFFILLYKIVISHDHGHCRHDRSGETLHKWKMTDRPDCDCGHSVRPI